jgi:hypothetical protein
VHTTIQLLRFPIIRRTLYGATICQFASRRFASPEVCDFHYGALEHSDHVILTKFHTDLVIHRYLILPARLPTTSSLLTTSKMESMLIIPDHPPNPYYPYSTMGDESRPSQCPVRKADDPTGDKAHFDLGLLSLGIDFWDDEHPLPPFRFLDLPLEIQLEIVDILSESHENYDMDEYILFPGHPLLDLRQWVMHLFTRVACST